MHPIRLISFGYLHLPTGPDDSPVPPAADRIEDVRDRLRDPAAARDTLDLDGLNPRVQDIVLNTPGAHELIANLADLPAGPHRCQPVVTGDEVDQKPSDRLHRLSLFIEVRSYAFDLLRWWRWLRVVQVEWDRATSAEVRDFVLWLRIATKPRTSARTQSAATAGTTNTITKKPYLDDLSSRARSGTATP